MIQPSLFQCPKIYVSHWLGKMYIYETFNISKRSSLKSSNYPLLLFKLYWQSKPMQRDQKGVGGGGGGAENSVH